MQAAQDDRPARRILEHDDPATADIREDVATIGVAPQMPQLTASITNGPGEPGVNWRLRVSYTEGNRNDVVYFPALDPAHPDVFPFVEDGAWNIGQAIGTYFVGGDATLYFRFCHDMPDGEWEEFEFDILGMNATRPTVRQRLGGLRQQLVAWRESRFQQFQSATGFVQSWEEGPFSVLRAADNGYGTMQLTSGDIPIGQLWNWHQNVDEGVSRLAGFMQNAQTYVAQVRGGLPWTSATGGNPPREGVAFPKAPDFTSDEMDLEVWSRYNSGYRYHDYEPETRTWERRESTSTGMDYAEELAAWRDQIEDNEVYPPLWGN